MHIYRKIRLVDLNSLYDSFVKINDSFNSYSFLTENVSSSSHFLDVLQQIYDYFL